MRLSLYFARRFLWTFLLVFGAFFGLLLLIDVVDQLRRGAGDMAASRAIYLALMNAPQNLYRILPLIVILSAIALFLALARSSELVAVRASGRSGLRFLLAPFAAALAVGLLAVAVLDPLVAATSKEYARMAGSADGQSVLSVTSDGLWMRQGDDKGQSVIRAARAAPDGSRLDDVSFFLFSPEGLAIGRIEARSAELQASNWVLTGAKRWDLTVPNPEAIAEVQPDGARLPTDLTPQRIRDGFGEPSTIAFWDLPKYIRELEDAGFSARNYRVWMQMELALPLLLGAMVLVAAGFTMRHARFGKTGQLTLMALAAGFALFFLRNFAQVLGENGQIPIMAAAWSPPVAALLLSIALLLHVEDG